MHRAPPLNALRSFAAAARCLSFADAAAQLFVTPAAVSHQVQRLEAQLGVRLFERRHRAVVLTEAGARLAARLHGVFAELDDAVDQAVAGSQPRIRVSALPSLAAKWLVPRLHRFATAHPALRVLVGTGDHLVNFAYEPIDIGLRYGEGDYRGLHVEKLLDASAFPVCSPQLLTSRRGPLRQPSQLRQLTLLHDQSSERNPGVPNWSRWLKAAGAHGIDAERGPVFASIHLALEAALAGHGVAMGVAPLVQQDLRDGRLVRPFALELPNAFSFWLVCRRNRRNEPGIREFRHWLRAEAASGT